MRLGVVWHASTAISSLWLCAYASWLTDDNLTN
jgi:hypothetical protein